MNIKKKSFWSQKKIIKIYNEDRKNLKDLYYAEKIFLKNCLFENCSILDIGCAQGGFNSIIKTNDFSDNFDNITFFIQKKNDKNEMENIFISDKEDALATLSPTEVKENEDISIFASR